MSEMITKSHALVAQFGCVWSHILCINSYDPFGYISLAKRTNIKVLSDWRHIVFP